MRRWDVVFYWLMSSATALAGGLAIVPGSAFASEPLAECAAHHRMPSASTFLSRPESGPVAQVDAASLLADLPLPPGSRESATEPEGGGSLLAYAGFAPATPNLVDEHAWWLVPLAPAEAVAYVCAHLPPGTTLESLSKGPGGPGAPDNETAAFSVPGSYGTLVVGVVRLPDGSTALRADGEVVWITPRPVSETIPAGVRLLRIAVDGFRGYRPERLALLLRLPSQVTSAAQVAKITALLNELEVVQPGLRHCPVGFGDSVELTFLSRSEATTPLAVADIETAACGGVELMLGGTRQPPLQGGWSLVEDIGKALGVSATAGPPIGSVPRVSRVRMSPAKFRYEDADTVTVGATPGSELRFDLSAPADVRVVLRRRVSQRRVFTCDASATGSRRARTAACWRAVKAAKPMHFTEPPGTDSIPLAGRGSSRTLRPGSYIVTLTATNTSGRSRTVSVLFEITSGVGRPLGKDAAPDTARLS